MLLKVNPGTALRVNGQPAVVRETSMKSIGFDGLCDEIELSIKCQDGNVIVLELDGFALSERDLRGFAQFLTNG